MTRLRSVILLAVADARTLKADPPLERGDHLDIFLDSPRGDVEDHQVM